jgi:hypothetical protein
MTLKASIHAGFRGFSGTTTYLIEREEQRIETLKEWGAQSYNDENHYSKGIKAAKTRIDDYQAQIKDVGTAPC